MFIPTVDSEKHTKAFDGFYRGVVVDVNDPLESGRIRAKVYPMFENVADDTLPWAILADSNFGGIINEGKISVPSIGAHVFVFFENGDHRFPVYFAGAPAIQDGVPDLPKLSREDDGTVAAINSAASKGVSTASGGSWDEPDSSYATVYPNNKVYRSAGGVIIEIDDTQDNVRFHVYHPSGTRTEVDNSGNKVDHVSAKKTTVIIGDDNIEVKGKQDTTTAGNHGIKIGANGMVKVTGTYDIDVGGNVTINSGGSATVNASGTATVKGSTVVISGGTVNIN
jgi:type VI secretion system secreted protein VgrG